MPALALPGQGMKVSGRYGEFTKSRETDSHSLKDFAEKIPTVAPLHRLSLFLTPLADLAGAPAPRAWPELAWGVESLTLPR